MKRFAFNTFVLIISTLFFRFIDILFTSYITRKIGTEQFGQFQLIMTVYLFGITLATSGINLSVTRIISEELALGNTNKLSKIMNNSIYFSLIASILTCIIFYFNKTFIVSTCLKNQINYNIIYLICLALPLISISSAISGYFAGIRKIYKNSIGQFLEHISKIIITFILLNYIFPNNLNYACFSLILGDLISEIISLIYIYIIFLFDINKYKISTCKNSTNYFYKILRISIPVSITSYIRSGLSSFKQILIPEKLQSSGFNSSNALSYYGVISGMAMPIILFPDIIVKALSSLLIPEFSKYYTKKDFFKIKKMSILLLKLTFIFSLLLTIIIFISSNFIGNYIYKNNEVIFYIKILAPLAIFIYTDSIIDSILRGLDAQVGVMFINILDLLISTTFIYFAVPYLGILGYIISIYISEILNFLASLFELIKIIKKDKRHSM